MPLFGRGNKAARGKHSRIGPQLLEIPGRRGWYITHYVNRAKMRNVTIQAAHPHGLVFREDVKHGLEVTDVPAAGSQYRSILQVGDVITRVGNTKLHTVSEFDRVISENVGKTINLSINKGGKWGSQLHCKKAGRNKVEATEYFRRWEQRRRSEPGDVLERGVFFSRLADEFLLWAKTAGGYSAAWLKEVTRTMTVHKRHWGSMTLEQMTPHVISEWMTERLAQESSPGRRVSLNTFMNEFKPLRVAFKLAVKQWRYLKVNPTADLTIRKNPQSLPKYLEAGEIDALMKAAHDADAARLKPGKSTKGGATVSCTGTSPEQIRQCYNADGTFDTARIRFLLLAALRKSQLIDLKWTNYDEQRGTLTFQTADGHYEKSRRITVIPLPDAAKEIMGGQPRNSDFIFPNLKGGRDTEIAIRFRRIADVAEKECHRHMHLHMLRHTALTHLLKHSQNIAAVSKYAGHADVKTTQIYAHVLDDQLREITKDFDITKPSVPASVPAASTSHTALALNSRRKKAAVPAPVSPTPKPATTSTASTAPPKPPRKSKA